MVQYKFDRPGTPDIQTLEAMSWSGDSGGPMLIEVDGKYKIAGVNSNGDCCNYDNVDNYARLGDTAREWIMSTIEGEAPTPLDCSGYGAP